MMSTMGEHSLLIMRMFRLQVRLLPGIRQAGQTVTDQRVAQSIFIPGHSTLEERHRLIQIRRIPRKARVVQSLMMEVL